MTEPTIFTIDDRTRIHERLLHYAKSDTRIVAAAVVGSLAHDEGDRWSDLDLTFAVADYVPLGVQAEQDAAHHLLGPLPPFRRRLLQRCDRRWVGKFTIRKLQALEHLGNRRLWHRGQYTTSYSGTSSAASGAAIRA